MSNGSKIKNFSPEKSDIFSLGVTLLQTYLGSEISSKELKKVNQDSKEV